MNHLADPSLERIEQPDRRLNVHLPLNARIRWPETCISSQVKKSCFCRRQVAEEIILQRGSTQLNLVAKKAPAQRLSGSNFAQRAINPLRPGAFPAASAQGMHRAALKQELMKNMRADETVGPSNDDGVHIIHCCS